MMCVVWSCGSKVDVSKTRLLTESAKYIISRHYCVPCLVYNAFVYMSGEMGSFKPNHAVKYLSLKLSAEYDGNLLTSLKVTIYKKQNGLLFPDIVYNLQTVHSFYVTLMENQCIWERCMILLL